MNTCIVDLPIENQEMLNEFNDIIIDDLLNELPLERHKSPY